MRVAVVSQPFDGVLPPSQNSIGIWTYEVARRMAERHDVTVHAPRRAMIGRGRPPRRVRDGGVTYRMGAVAPMRVWSKIAGLWDRVFGAARPLYASALYYIEYSLPVALRLRRERPDVIHIHNLTGFVPVIRALNRRARIVLHMNCEWLSQLDERTMARRIGRVDAVFGSSDHITNLVRRRFPQHAERCHTVYNGVDPDAFVAAAEPRSSSGPIVAFVGRVSPEKGVHDLLDAVPEVVRRHPSATFNIIGPEDALPKSFIVDVSDDPLIADLARFYDRGYREVLAERVTGDGHVRFLGSLPHDDVIRHVREADLLVNPSYSESFGMSLVEALACQTPVVATRVGGMPEIIRDDAGTLVERNDPGALAAAINDLLDDAERRREMGAAGRRRVEDVFAWTRIAARAESLYAALLGSRRA